MPSATIFENTHKGKWNNQSEKKTCLLSCRSYIWDWAYQWQQQKIPSFQARVVSFGIILLALCDTQLEIAALPSLPLITRWWAMGVNTGDLDQLPVSRGWCFSLSSSEGASGNRSFTLDGTADKKKEGCGFSVCRNAIFGKEIFKKGVVAFLRRLWPRCINASVNLPKWRDESVWMR